MCWRILVGFGIDDAAGDPRRCWLPQPLELRLVLRRLALAEREREVAAARAHVLDTGDLRNHTAARGEDVGEELGVTELVLAVDVVEVAPTRRTSSRCSLRRRLGF